MNTEWKKGYEEGFAAGWKAASANVARDYSYKNFPPVYYGRYPNGDYRNGFVASMAEQPYTTGQFSMAEQPYTTGQFSSTTTVSNLTDHTKIV